MIYSLHIYVYIHICKSICKLSLYVIEYRVASKICARGIAHPLMRQSIKYTLDRAVSVKFPSSVNIFAWATWAWAWAWPCLYAIRARYPMPVCLCACAGLGMGGMRQTRQPCAHRLDLITLWRESPFPTPPKENTPFV